MSAAPQRVSEEVELRFRRKLRDSFEFYAPRALKIRTKDGRMQPFTLNKAQMLLHMTAEKQRADKGWVRIIVVKGRQQGISTYIEGRFYWRVTHRKGAQAFILTHEQPATDNLFKMAERYHENCPPEIRPATGASNAKELSFPKIDSGYKVGTAGSKGTGRSSTIQYFHGCLSPDTPIIDGDTGALRKMSHFHVGDKVRTHTGEVARVSFISRQMKSVKRLFLKGLRDFPLVSTDEHRFWTESGWRRLEQIAIGDRIGFPVHQVTGELSGFGIAYQHMPRHQGGGAQPAAVPECLPATLAMGRVLGLYLAEGTIIRQNSGGQCSGVVFTVHDREAARTVAWLQEANIPHSSITTRDRKGCRTTTVQVYGRAFAEFVESQCGSVDSKRLPPEWWRYPREFVEGLVLGYLSGDGHSSKADNDRRISATSIRSAITIGMRDALASLGYGWATVNHKPAGIRHGRNEKEAWTLRLCGTGVDALSEKIGWQMPPRRRHGNYGAVTVSGGYAWIPVVEVQDIGLAPVMDFEVDHPDHSYCALQAATHNSEVAFWPHADTHAMGVMQAIPLAPDTEIFLESTTNGIGNYFHAQSMQAMRGESDFILVFLPWYWQDEYRRPVPAGFKLRSDEEDNEVELLELYGPDGLTKEHLVWRRHKIMEFNASGAGADDGLWRFRQEYPMDIDEAFQTSGEAGLINPKAVARARKRTVAPLATAAKIVGVDPARFGRDRTSICWRQGRQVYKLESHRKLNTMQVAGLCARILRDPVTGDDTDIDMMFVDEGGLGAGVVDRLHELGFEDRVRGVNSAESPIDVDRFYNKRAEMWGEMNEWLQLAVDIPDSDSLQADLCGPMYKYDSADRMVLERKEHMMERGLPSPDEGDAMALTFAFPVVKGARRAPRVEGHGVVDTGIGY